METVSFKTMVAEVGTQMTSIHCTPGSIDLEFDTSGVAWTLAMRFLKNNSISSTCHSSAADPICEICLPIRGAP